EGGPNRRKGVSAMRGQHVALTLMALVLPTALLARSIGFTAALANSVDFITGSFISGTLTRTAPGGFAPPSFSPNMVGSLDSTDVTITALGLGCSVATRGSCTFGSGTLTVTSSGGGVLFTDSLVDGPITRFPASAIVTATFLPNSISSASGVVTLVVVFW